MWSTLRHNTWESQATGSGRGEKLNCNAMKKYLSFPLTLEWHQVVLNCDNSPDYFYYQVSQSLDASFPWRAHTLEQASSLWLRPSKESDCHCRRHKRHGFNPWVGKILGVGNGNPLRYSCLENSMDRGIWWAIINGVTKSWAWLSDWLHVCPHTCIHTHIHTHLYIHKSQAKT